MPQFEGHCEVSVDVLPAWRALAILRRFLQLGGTPRGRYQISGSHAPLMAAKTTPPGQRPANANHALASITSIRGYFPKVLMGERKPDSGDLLRDTLDLLILKTLS